MWRRPALLVVGIALLVGACSGDPPAASDTLSTAGQTAATTLEVEVLEQLAHDPTSSTQGLLLNGATIYESTGTYGGSSLIELHEPELSADGATDSGFVASRRVPVGEDYFAEGLALVDDRLVQLTWKEETAFVYDLDTLEVIDEYDYDGEGWGLCLQTGLQTGSDRLVMSDGSDTLTFRDPDTFEETGTVDVRLDGVALPDLNELECVDDHVYANVWRTEHIVVIDPESGEVTAVIDAGELVAENEGADVLNGIAYDEAGDTFLVTGKLWPSMYRVRFVESGPA